MENFGFPCLLQLSRTENSNSFQKKKNTSVKVCQIADGIVLRPQGGRRASALKDCPLTSIDANIHGCPHTYRPPINLNSVENLVDQI